MKMNVLQITYLSVFWFQVCLKIKASSPNYILLIAKRMVVGRQIENFLTWVKTATIAKNVDFFVTVF